MAPAREDDFVLTLSDGDDNEAITDGYDNGEDGEDGAELEKSTSAKKRKRESEPSITSKGKSKKQKGQEQDKEKLSKKDKKQKKNKSKHISNGTVDSEESADENEEDEEDATNDGAMNPEFEFDVGNAVTRGTIEGFDAWGLGDVENKESRDGGKKGVDIDEIISRRNARKEEEDGLRKGQKREDNKKEKGKKDKRGRKDGEEEGKGDSENEMADDEDAYIDFKDDELLAGDSFGMGANGEQESEESEAEDHDDSESGDDAEDGKANREESGEDKEGNSDDESVASPVAHPDDVASDQESANEDNESEVDAAEEEKRKAFFAPETDAKVSSAIELSNSSFQNFNLSRPILRGLTSLGFTNPTPIQKSAIPIALLGKDIVGSAVTGSGKTAAFVVPILERLLFRPRKMATSRVAILMPTRELAVQCYSVATKLATYTDITFCQLVGGFSLREQENVLKKRPDVIIATPGRFIDHMRNSASFTVDTLEILVLDEADRMLEDGFADELNEILTTIPKSRQTMLFSATMTDTVDKLIRVGLNRPVRLMVDAKSRTSGKLVQEFVRLRPGREDKRLGYLLYLCKEVYTGRVIIFFRQKREAHRVRVVFGLLGLKAAELHGSMSQEQVCLYFQHIPDYIRGLLTYKRSVLKVWIVSGTGRPASFSLQT